MAARPNVPVVQLHDHRVGDRAGHGHRGKASSSTPARNADAASRRVDRPPVRPHASQRITDCAGLDWPPASSSSAPSAGRTPSSVYGTGVNLVAVGTPARFRARPGSPKTPSGDGRLFAETGDGLRVACPGTQDRPSVSIGLRSTRSARGNRPWPGKPQTVSGRRIERTKRRSRSFSSRRYLKNAGYNVPQLTASGTEGAQARPVRRRSLPSSSST